MSCDNEPEVDEKQMNKVYYKKNDPKQNVY